MKIITIYLDRIQRIQRLHKHELLKKKGKKGSKIIINCQNMKNEDFPWNHPRFHLEVWE